MVVLLTWIMIPFSLYSICRALENVHTKACSETENTSGPRVYRQHHHPTPPLVSQDYHRDFLLGGRKKRLGSPVTHLGSRVQGVQRPGTEGYPRGNVQDEASPPERQRAKAVLLAVVFHCGKDT